MNRYSITAEQSDAGSRLDKWLTEQTEFDISRSAAVKLIEGGSVRSTA